MNLKELKAKAKQIRGDAIHYGIKYKQGHIAPSLSTVEILVALFYDVLGLGDQFVMGKGHGCYAYYSILADKGFMPPLSGPLSGCVERNPRSGIPFSTGSLGTALPSAVGLAYALKHRKAPFRVYVLVGDGEMQEGSNWEALTFALHHQLSNLFILIDQNDLQAMDKRICVVEGGENTSLFERLKGWGCQTLLADGHAFNQIKAVLKAPQKLCTPRTIVFETIKGCGVDFMEGVPMWHYRVPEGKEAKHALQVGKAETIHVAKPPGDCRSVGKR